MELQGYESFLLDSVAAYEALLRKVLKRPFHAPPVTGAPPALATTQARPLFDRPGAPASAFAGSVVPVDISRIIKYAPEELIGREAETQFLNDAWAKVLQHDAKRPRIVTFVALGGEGKTSLVAKWAADLAAQDWPGCDAVFAWSFYSQGTHEQTAVSSDLFLAEALTFFGDDAMAKSAAGAFDKGRRLARLVGERRGLLILDGLEPLQYAPTSPTPGELKDAGLSALLKGLAATSLGLCVVTTRYALPDLRAYHGKTVREEKLLRLSRAAGVQLLKAHGVIGSDRRNIPLTDSGVSFQLAINDATSASKMLTPLVSEFEKLVEDVDGHALTLHLMGSFLKRAFQGDIRRRDHVTFAKASQKTDNDHAFRAMAAYEKWMADGSEEARRELALLSLMGLFDRPATADCLQALLQAPAIAGLTEPLVGLPEEDFNFSLTALQDARLLTVNRDAAGSLLSLDAHPLLREYFSRSWKCEGVKEVSNFQLQTSHFREAHRRLYEHLCATTKDQPDASLEDLQPLYQAVAHGCQAGLQQEACDKVYFSRILRRNEFYSSKKLGALGSGLGAVACFFETQWSRVSPALTEVRQAWLLNETAYYLRALGRLTEALEPMRAAMNINASKSQLENAAASASNLSELELTLGEVARAVGDAEQSVTYADRSGDANWKYASRTTHADALHRSGRRAEAEARFREAEQMQAESQPEYKLLYSIGGFRYCDLLLAAAERAAWHMLGRAIEFCRAVSERAAQSLKWAERSNIALLDIALDHLTLGRAALYAAILKQSEISNSKSEIEKAVSGLRRAGTQQYRKRSSQPVWF